jgi:hypothetical protein
MMHNSSMRWGEEAPVQTLGSLHVHFEGDRAPSEEVDPNDLPGGDQVHPFVVAPRPGVPVAPDALYFRDGELVRILGRLVWFESNGGHMIIQDTQDSRGPGDPESVHQAIVDLRDDMGSAHQNLFCMQNVMDDRRVEQVKMEDMVNEMSVRLQQLEKCFEKFILDKWALFRPTILQSLSTVAFAGQACLQSHAAYQPPPPSLSGFAPFRVPSFGCSRSFRTSFPLRLLSCTLGLVLTTSASTVSSASSVLALLSIGLVVNVSPYLISPFPNPFLSYLAHLSYHLSIYSLDDGRTRDSKS